MKGIIFKEFLNMVEEKFGYTLVDQIIIDSNLPNDGAYTSVGTYPHTELVLLVKNLSKHTKIEVPKLLEIYGEHAFGIFAVNYKPWFIGHNSAFSFLASVENTIHVEVKKLYPEAQLPTLIVKNINAIQIELIYKSSRQMSDFALGLIKGCLNHFNEEAKIIQTIVIEDKSEVQFIITKTL